MMLFFISLLILCDISHSTTKILLTQNDFEHGTYLLTQPGYYVLAEDIVFNPNSPSVTGFEPCRAGLPLPTQYSKYDPAAFSVGFFAAIAISAKGVKLDLNGHTISQHRQHYLLQRFYANIELADRPFIPKQGPSNFGSPIAYAEDVEIFNGVLGLSSHHGIHGNLNKNVHIHDVTFIDYEVAAVAINGGSKIKIEHCEATARTGIPVLGIFSNGRFMQAYVDYLAKTQPSLSLNIQGVNTSIETIKNNLCSSMNNVYKDFIPLGSISPTTHVAEYNLFHNPTGLIDGNHYGFLINSKGAAVDGFADGIKDDRASDINLINLTVHLAAAAVLETPALKNSAGKPIIDAVGGIFQIFNKAPSGESVTISSSQAYLGNPVADAQAVVAKAKLAGLSFGPLDVSRVSFTQSIIDWIESNGAPLHQFHNTGFLCNGDIMFHVNKGVVVFRVDAADGVNINNCKVIKALNLGGAGNRELCNYSTNQKSHPAATLLGYNGNDLRAFSIADCSNLQIKDSLAQYLMTASGDAVGFDVFTTSSKVKIDTSKVDSIQAGVNFKTYSVIPISPNKVPSAIGFRCTKATTSDITFNRCAVVGKCDAPGAVIHEEC